MSGARPHRVVIDPNAFISATITPNGALDPIISLIDDGTLVPALTQHLVNEVVEVLGRAKPAKYVKPGAGATFHDQMDRLGEWHADIVDPPSSARDPKDDYLVALALAAGAEAITGGDEDLQVAKDVGVKVLTPRELLTRLGLLTAPSASFASARFASPQVGAAFRQQRNTFEMVRHREHAHGPKRRCDRLRLAAAGRQIGRWPALMPRSCPAECGRAAAAARRRRPRGLDRGRRAERSADAAQERVA